MENLTLLNISNNTLPLNENVFDCEDLTNNGLYMIFIGYLVPLLSPTMRDYLRDLFINFKNFGEVAGKVVSLTEFGFTKIQNINNNTEMVQFIERVCDKKNIGLLPEQIVECAWAFSGDTGKGKRKSLEGSWSKLLKEIDRIHSVNVMQRSNRKRRP